MKILLAAINSKYIHTSPAVDSLQAYAAAGGLQAGSLSFTINQPEEQILGQLFEADADVYCFSVYIWNCSFVYRLSRDLKAVKPGIMIWYGGPEVSFRSREILKEHPEVTGIMRGEGEETFSELVKRLSGAKGEEKEIYNKDQDNNRDDQIEGIRGISFRGKSGEIRENPDRDPLKLDALVFPYQGTEPDRNRIYYYESSRGCPFGCSYCLSSIDKQLRFKSLEKVYRELDWFLENRVRQVKFVDRTFNLDGRSEAEQKSETDGSAEPRYLKIWKYLKEHDNGLTNFHFEICGELLREEELEFLKTVRPGQIQFEIGVQTANPETLASIHRYRDGRLLKKNVKSLLEGRNIHIHLDLIAGLPYEDLQSFRNSFDEVFSLEPLQLQLGFLKVLKGTPMEVFAKDHGFVYSQEPPFEIRSNRWISFGELLVLKAVEEMVEVYYNSRQFERTLKKLLESYESPFELFYELSRFYKKRGYDRMDHARMKRYEILLEFIKEGCPAGAAADEEEFIPLLLEDAVSRERLKHWPQWAGCRQKPEGYDYERRDPLTGNALRLL